MEMDADGIDSRDAVIWPHTPVTSRQRDRKECPREKPGEAHMPDNQITTFNTLKPTMVRAIREVFDDAVRELEKKRGAGAPPLSDEARAVLARKLVEMARHGECSAERLKSAAVSLNVS